MRHWIERGDAVAVYSPNGTYGEELNRFQSARELLYTFRQSGKAIRIDEADIEADLNQIPDRPIRQSNDPHILALAVASKATILFSCDAKLCKDFANRQVLSNVGRRRRKNVPHLLNNLPEDTTKASQRKRFFNDNKCTLHCN